MKLENFGLLATEAIEKMFQALSNDLGNGVSEEKAGWRPSADFGIGPPDQSELLRRGIVERNSRGQFRLNFKNSRIRQEFKTLDLQFEQLDCFLRDTEEVKKAQKVLKQITEMLQTTPEYWTYVIALGWWKMLEVSEMPARVDDILGEGFSPKDWMVKAPRSSSQLALNIARKYGEIEDFEGVINFLEKTRICNIQDVILPLPLNQDDVQKVMKVLKWGEIEAELTISNVKVLAFFWSFLFILKCRNSLPLSTEFSLKLNEIIWNSLENLLKEKQSNLLRDLENTVSTLTAEGIIWASDILYLPEII
ncbi:MAG: hypothetical protein COZ67_01290 [Chloroflexi bacterium CG_4_8_14_3_um_filter_45_15]|nr:MAG: hypothetical protein COZ67_01290 [Chloroflexi bacterium CG_4_8_14_3_um_filter_45_15]